MDAPLPKAKLDGDWSPTEELPMATESALLVEIPIFDSPSEAGPPIPTQLEDDIRKEALAKY